MSYGYWQFSLWNYTGNCVGRIVFKRVFWVYVSNTKLMHFVSINYRFFEGHNPPPPHPSFMSPPFLVKLPFFEIFTNPLLQNNLHLFQERFSCKTNSLNRIFWRHFLLLIQLKSELYFNLMVPFYGSVQLSQCYRSTTRREFTFRKFELQRNLTG